MDLHFTSDLPTQDEVEALDGAGIANGAAREFLLPALHAVQGRAGCVSRGAVNEIARRLGVPPAEVHGVASFYHLFEMESGGAAVVAHVCDDIACMARGAEELCTSMAGSGVAWKRSPCLGLCERAPAALVVSYGKDAGERVVAPATAEAIAAGVETPDLAIPQAGQAGLKLLRHVGRGTPPPEFEAYRKAVAMGREAVVREVVESRLAGRGGAAFPTGRKWGAVVGCGYVVCNADESEPGTFKDRVVMEGDPYSVIEGLAIAAFAVGARKGYIYIRGEYPVAARRLAEAIAKSSDALGLTIELRRGAGAYICGEETALFNSIEGYRGEPRNKPPYPTVAGLFGKPTVVNNVETLLNIPEIILHGGAAFARTGGGGNSTGHRLFCLSGHVARPGVYEVPMGVTLRALLELAGGATGDLQAVLLGGAAGTFLTPEELDLPLTFEATRAAGASLGSGVVMAFDRTVDLKRILDRIARFFKEESCGQCVPCRIGTIRQQELMLGGGSAAELRELGQTMRDASICGLGQTASSAIESALDRWRILPG